LTGIGHQLFLINPLSASSNAVSPAGQLFRVVTDDSPPGGWRIGRLSDSLPDGWRIDKLDSLPIGWLLPEIVNSAPIGREISMELFTKNLNPSPIVAIYSLGKEFHDD
jgi:hypothetical protein